MTSPEPAQTDAPDSAAARRLAVERQCLAELRAELSASYPAVGASALVRIARRHGLDRFPDGFLVDGLLSERGPRAFLAAANRGGRGQGSAHPLFSDTYYSLQNPDVAAAGISAWAHYQRFGRSEGRSPHPLIDTATLAAALPGVRREHLVDEYLADRRAWFVDPGPYVNVRRFGLDGNWDGQTHPLRSLALQLDGPWVHGRLLLVDSRSAPDAQARLLAGAYLLTRNGGRSRLGRLQAWSLSGSDAPDEPATVVPGYFLGRGGAELQRLGDAAVSPDGTLVRLAGETVGLPGAQESAAPSLVMVTGSLGREALAALAEESGGAVIAPFDRAQEISLRQLRRDRGHTALRVLEHGVQVRLDAASIRVVPGAPLPRVAAWQWSSAGAGDAAVVLPASERRRATGDPALRALLAAGAALCLVDEHGLNTWLPVIQSRSIVIVEPTLLAATASFVERTVLHTLPPREGSPA